jgi:competence protein ComEA
VAAAGAVAAPGVQRLPVGARVVDAVDAAGGASPDADLGRINLAAVLTDGQQVYVLRPGETPPAVVGATDGAPGDGGGPDGAGGAGGLINVNSASAAQLEELPGVGPATAEAIIAHRDQNGPFASVDELLDVRGIGEAKLEQLRDLATV